MGTLPLNDRLTVAVVAAGGQTVFAADFPALEVSGVYAGVGVRQVRAGVESFLILDTDFTIADADDDGFNAVLNTGALAGDVIQVFGELPAAREIALTPGGAIVTETYEIDADSFQAQLQEQRRDLGRAMLVPLGDPSPILPLAAQRASKYFGFDGEGNFSVINPPQSALPGTIVATAALLRTEASFDGKVCLMQTYSGVARSGGMFVFSATSMAAEDDGLVIKPTAIGGGAPGRWLRDLTGTPWVDLLWYGADPTYANDNSALFNPWVAAAQGAKLPAKASAGRYKFSSAQLINMRAVQYTGMEVFGDGSEKTVLDFRGVADFPNFGVGVPADLLRDNTGTLVPRAFDYFKIHSLSIVGDQAGHVFRLGLALDGNDGVGQLVQTGFMPTVAAYGYVDYCNYPEAYDFHVQNFNATSDARAADLNNFAGSSRWDMEANCGSGGYVGGLGKALRINNAQFARFLGSWGSAEVSVEIDGGFCDSLDFADVDMENVKTCIRITTNCQYVDDLNFDGGQRSYSSFGVEADFLYSNHVLMAEPHNNPAQAFVLNGTLTNGSAIVTAIANTDGLVAGRGVTGVGVPANTTILSIDTANQIHLSANATASGVKALTFAGPAASDFIKTGADYGVIWREAEVINTLTVNNQKAAVTTVNLVNGTSAAVMSLNSGNGQLLIHNSSPDAFMTLLVDVVGGVLQLNADVHQLALHDGTVVLSSAAGVFSFAHPITVGATQVVGARQAGWGAASSTLSRAAYASYAGTAMSGGYTQAQVQACDNAVVALSQRFAALITDLTTHGLIGP